MKADDGKDLAPGIFYKTFAVGEETVSGITLRHKNVLTARPCSLVINFDTQAMRRLSPATPKFTVLRLLPLTIEEKIRCRCGLVGYVTDGRWEPEG